MRKEKVKREKDKGINVNEVSLSPILEGDFITNNNEATFRHPLPKDTLRFNSNVDTVKVITMPQTDIKEGIESLGNMIKLIESNPNITDYLTHKEIMGTITEYFMSKAVIAKVYDIAPITAYRWMIDLNVKSKREKDLEYAIAKQQWNEDYPRSLITHAMDFYRLSNGSIQRMHHARGNYKIEGNTILLGCIVNIKTGVTHWKTWLADEETEYKAIDIIQTALDKGEDIKAIQMDRVLNKIIDDCEGIGITVACYGKSVTHPYNSEIERMFAEISKVYYLLMGVGYGHYSKSAEKQPKKYKYYRNLLSVNRFEGLTVNEAVELFEAIVYANLDGRVDKLILFDLKQKLKRLETISQIQIPITISDKIKVTE